MSNPYSGKTIQELAKLIGEKTIIHNAEGETLPLIDYLAVAQKNAAQMFESVDRHEEEYGTKDIETQLASLQRLIAKITAGQELNVRNKTALAKSSETLDGLIRNHNNMVTEFVAELDPHDPLEKKFREIREERGATPGEEEKRLESARKNLAMHQRAAGELEDMKLLLGEYRQALDRSAGKGKSI